MSRKRLTVSGHICECVLRYFLFMQLIGMFGRACLRVHGSLPSVRSVPSTINTTKCVEHPCVVSSYYATRLTGFTKFNYVLSNLSRSKPRKQLDATSTESLSRVFRKDFVSLA